MAKFFISLGIFFVLIGILFLLKVNFSWIGRLPGDLSFKLGKVQVYIPIMTSILASILLTLFSFLFYFFKSK